jgi:hypothetical protein
MVPSGGIGNGLGRAGSLTSERTASNSMSRSAAPAACAISPHTSDSSAMAPEANMA